MLKQEMDIAYFRWAVRPGSYLGVLDNASEYNICKSRVHCNATHGSIAPGVAYNEDTAQYEIDQTNMQEKLDSFNSMSDGRRHTIVGGAEHNNVYFPDFIKYKKTLPECLMQTIDGKYLELHDKLILGGQGIPMPAIDDPTLIKLYSRSLSIQAKFLKDSQYVVAYVVGSEMLYPEYFGLGNGDFRSASWKHFVSWCKYKGIQDIPKKEEVSALHGTLAWYYWLQYREQAMADRCANYYKAILEEDQNHLVYYPTHGSSMVADNRWTLGQQVDSLASACDGMEMGHILIGDDRERRNAIMTAYFTSYGTPVIIPRLGNKQPDLSAIGGGRSFSPETLRRFFYECVGLGIHTIFPIHWSSRLHDGEWCIKDTLAEATCRKIFDEMVAAGPYLDGMGRMQSQVGLYVSDLQWMIQWNPKWTGFFQDALSFHALMTIVTDILLGSELIHRIPVLVTIDCEIMADSAVNKLFSYINAGGKLIIIGAFADRNEKGQRDDFQIVRNILAHSNVTRINQRPEKNRYLRELFLSGPEYGIEGKTFEYEPIDFSFIENIVKMSDPNCIFRPVILNSKESLKGINIFPLTDRTSLLAVIINNTARPSSFTIHADPRISVGSNLIDILSGEIISDNITIDANSTKMIWFYPDVKEDAMLEIVYKAENSYNAWKEAGYDVQSLRVCYTAMRSGCLIAKRFVMASTLLNTIVIKAESKRMKDGLEVICRIINADQYPVKGLSVSLRISPGTFDRFIFEERGEDYSLFIPNDKLPVIYDMEDGDYKTVIGQVRLIVSAGNKYHQGGCIVHVKI
jgi:hypothetical protein